MKSICVFCGSNEGSHLVYKDVAKELSKELVSRQMVLVYGGGSVGLMGVLSTEIIKLGGEAIGVIPKFLADKELAHSSITELHVVDSMHERKARMAELSDGFIALPGGIGTLEELFEIYTWAQLGLHTKPCGVLNVNGYYDHLIAFLNHMVQEQFMKTKNQEMLLIKDNAPQLLEAMAEYQSPKVSKWIKNQNQT
jgi:hypothetical protein